MTPDQPSVAVPTRQDIQTAYREELEPRARAVLWSWLGFTVTFGTVRAITYSIRAGRGPLRNLRLGGQHLHHYLWGIGMVTAVGGLTVFGHRRHRRHPVTGLTYGAGLALIVDEFALLLDLKDVYWDRQGRLSVDLGIGLVAVGGTSLSLAPIVRRVRRDMAARNHRRAPSTTAKRPRPARSPMRSGSGSPGLPSKPDHLS